MGNAKLFQKFEKYIADTSENSGKRTQNFLNNVLLELKTREPLLVTGGISRKDGCYAKCPNCDATFDREFIAYCHVCGQKLKWPSLKKIKYIPQEEYARKMRAKWRKEE